MSGATVPYHLRPHKAVDRRLFLDLLARLERWTPFTDYSYISMGAYRLEDHKLVHRLLGLKNLLCFDAETQVVARQKFNAPINSCHCKAITSGKLVETFDKVLQECGFSEDSGTIIWLDYTEAYKIGEQIREFESLISRLGPGDVVRVTVNAHPKEMFGNQNQSQTEITQKRIVQLQDLKNWIGDFLPSTATADDMAANKLPAILAASFASAASKALPATGPIAFMPLSLVRYADGQQMLSITGTLVRVSQRTDMLARLNLNTWPFYSKTWKDIHHLVVPDLTIRERLFIEKEIFSKTPDEIEHALGFTSASEIPIRSFIESFKKYYRFYPTLLASEI